MRTKRLNACLTHSKEFLRLPTTLATLAKTKEDYQGRITIEPGKRGGRPCIRGVRITVYDVLEYLASGMSEEEILHDFPELTREDIKACLSFAAVRERRLRAATA